VPRGFVTCIVQAVPMRVTSRGAPASPCGASWTMSRCPRWGSGRSAPWKARSFSGCESRPATGRSSR